ncbi:microtubule-binding protein TANGLED [Impatiens glandulifera]|uniref:microtubule-binding protein TANGLED n=1 Tax=Impatiens glandulifera TaxID=253017 RepID=UPI001FB0C944|nr:microtubule-binding protein TANGLED [Impatiens glandulifera]
MVARTPPKLRKMAAAPLNPTLLKETLQKVDKCMERLQELQYVVAGGKKVISGVNLSPRSTRGYLKTSLRCKQESLRIKNGNPKKSPNGKFPINSGEWRRMSLPAMLVEETVGEILQASKFARQIVSTVNSTTNKIHPSDDNSDDNPKTPPSRRQSPARKNPEKTQLRARRKREKQVVLQSIRSDIAGTPTAHLQRAKSRINFKSSSPLQREKENVSYLANRVSPRNRPWERKTVLFPNPLFRSSSSPTSQKMKFSKTNSPIIGKNRQTTTTTTTTATPHKFLIKKTAKIRSPPLSISPTRPSINMGKNSLKPSSSSSSKFSSAAVTTTMAKIRRSISPSRLANRLISPLKSRKSYDGLMMTNSLKQQQKQPSLPTATPIRLFSIRRV